MKNTVNSIKLKNLARSVALSAVVFVAGTTLALAEWAPSGPINLMIAFKAGGGADTQSRLIAEALEEKRGWKIIPSNVTGGGGAVLAKKLKDQPADALTIGMAVTETVGYAMLAAKNPGYGPEDFTYLTTTAGFQMGIVAMKDRGWKDFHDVVKVAKAGTPIRFGVMSPLLEDVTYLFGKNLGVEFRTVMLKGGKGVMNALNAGDVDVGWGAGIQAKAVLAGTMVNLASGNDGPLGISPDAPLITDMGSKYSVPGYFMMMAPAGIPEEARTTLASAIAEIVSDPNTKAGAFIEKGFGGAVTLQGAELDSYLAKRVVAGREILEAASE